MADIKTHLRELSVAVTVGLLKNNIYFKQSDLYSSQYFLAAAENIIDNDISAAANLSEYPFFTGDLKSIVDNGCKLGRKIYASPYFDICPDTPILWLGNDTQKGDPVDVAIGKYGFSLKEESFILKNMGLYQFLNHMTGSSYFRGLHIFKNFAAAQYEEWFLYTWQSFCQYLTKYGPWQPESGAGISGAFIRDSHIVMTYNGCTSYVPINIRATEQYMQNTSSLTREKVFAKWINRVFSEDTRYIQLKKCCAEAAGKKVSDMIDQTYHPSHMYGFFQIYPWEYYYAKTTAYETTILRVPSQMNFPQVISFQGCRYDVPTSQLNIITTFRNTRTQKLLEFRNECRFSHGQFNGTPEAKMYVTRHTSLTDLYEPL